MPTSLSTPTPAGAPGRRGAARPRLAVHKFSSCDGCQLALLNLGEGLLDIAERFEIVHFAEFGVLDETAEADVALVEGSLATPHDLERIAGIRQRSRQLVAIGACATSGGIQALRNLDAAGSWAASVYADPGQIELLERVQPISARVRVDLELWGCPVNAHQVLAALHDLAIGVTPAPSRDKLCGECKRIGVVCVMVARGLPCMGPVTQTGCGVLCPSRDRDCYGCSGPAELPNTASLAARWRGLGVDAADAAQRFGSINSQAPRFAQAAAAGADPVAGHG
jgi:coenzyme F420-reducing hydrogenase gamma subunit